ncbi:DNA-directed RNA polymerase subunit beta [Nocardia sp. CNY236]|uniref:DNA-directed RNA polymerase subunit beta n=1 Tax=Nocardia sp. CNY236 TaxID=1169152 RepID=UPI001E2E8E0C|nr:DNA-directed RNA polymerase subunit beta [Nocardia sp. CNY236]
MEPLQIGRIIVRTGRVWAVAMPEPLGQRVEAWMSDQGYEAGPILTHPRSRRWTFVVRPDLPDEVALFAEMFRLNVSIVRDGGTIALPGPADSAAGFRAWISPPVNAFRPSGRIVIDATRACRANGAFSTDGCT